MPETLELKSMALAGLYCGGTIYRTTVIGATKNGAGKIPVPKGDKKMIFIIGRMGTDGPYSYIGPDGKIHHVPGWNPEAMAEFDAAINIMKSASQLKAPGLAEAVVKSVLPFAQKEINTYFKGAGEGGVLVAGA